jgi:hypothetical protein
MISPNKNDDLLQLSYDFIINLIVDISRNNHHSLDKNLYSKWLQKISEASRALKDCCDDKLKELAND